MADAVCGVISYQLSNKTSYNMSQATGDYKFCCFSLTLLG